MPSRFGLEPNAQPPQPHRFGAQLSKPLDSQELAGIAAGNDSRAERAREMQQRRAQFGDTDAALETPTFEFDGQQVPVERGLEVAEANQTSFQNIANLGSFKGKMTDRLNESAVGQGILRGGQGVLNFGGSLVSLADEALGSGEMADNLRAASRSREDFMQFTEQGGQVEDYLGERGAKIFNGVSETLPKMIAMGAGGGTVGVYSGVAAEGLDSGLAQADEMGLTGASRLGFATLNSGIEMGVMLAMGAAGKKLGLSTLEESVSPGFRVAAGNLLQRANLTNSVRKTAALLGSTGMESGEEALTSVLQQGLTKAVNGEDIDWNEVLDAAMTGGSARLASGALNTLGDTLNKKLSPDKIRETTKGAAEAEKFFKILHGSPHKFEGPPSVEHLNTGEGTQWEGSGIYTTTSPETAMYYRDVGGKGKASTTQGRRLAEFRQRDPDLYRHVRDYIKAQGYPNDWKDKLDAAAQSPSGDFRGISVLRDYPHTEAVRESFPASGHLYEGEMHAKKSDFVQAKKAIGVQSPRVLKAIKAYSEHYGKPLPPDNLQAAKWFQKAESWAESPRQAAHQLAEFGLAGLAYGGSDSQTNFVAFRDGLIKNFKRVKSRSETERDKKHRVKRALTATTKKAFEAATKLKNTTQTFRRAFQAAGKASTKVPGDIGKVDPDQGTHIGGFGEITWPSLTAQESGQEFTADPGVFDRVDQLPDEAASLRDLPRATIHDDGSVSMARGGRDLHVVGGDEPGVNITYRGETAFVPAESEAEADELGFKTYNELVANPTEPHPLDPKPPAAPSGEAEAAVLDHFAGRGGEIMNLSAPGQPAPAAADPPAPPDEPYHVPIPDPTPLPSTTETKLESLNRDRAAAALEAVPPSQSRSWQEALDTAQKNGVPARALGVVTLALNKRRPLNDIETAGVAMALSDLKSQYDDLQLAYQADPTPAAVSRLMRIEEDFDLLTKAVAETRSEAGRALAAGKISIDRSYELLPVLQRAKEVKRSDLTRAERAKLDKLAATVRDAQAKLKNTKTDDERYKAEFDLDKAQHELMSAQAGLAPKAYESAAFDWLARSVNTSRALQTSGDLPPMLRQGFFTTLAHPVMSVKAAHNAIKVARSPEEQFKITRKIQERPNARYYEQGGLFIADPRSHKPGMREEQYMQNWFETVENERAKKILHPVKRYLEISEGMYTTYLNQIRADTFDALAATATRNGTPTEQEAKDIAFAVNTFTGRGGWARADNVLTALSVGVFAPRYTLSRFQAALGIPILNADGAAMKKAVAKQYARSAIGGAIIYGLAKAALGDEVEIETNPTNPDFMKLKFGKTRLDAFGGLSQTYRFLAKLAVPTNNKATEKVGQPLDLPGGHDSDSLARFARSKMAPGLATSIDMSTWEDFLGKEVTPESLLTNLTTPLSTRDVTEALEDQGVPQGSALWLISLFGAGLQTYAPRSSKKKSGGVERGQGRGSGRGSSNRGR